MPEFEPSQYLEQHIKVGDREQGQSLIDKLSESFGPFEYKESGEMSVQKGPFEIKLSYDSELNQPARSIISDQSLPEHNRKYYSVRGYKFSRLDRDQQLDLISLLPADYQVIVEPEHRYKSSPNLVDQGRKVILLRGDLASPAIILSLLHEIGHARSYDNKTAEGKHRDWKHRSIVDFGVYGIGDKPGQDDYAAVLRDERDAWAFALGKIRLLLDSKEEVGRYSITKKDVRSMIHNWALQGYNKMFANELGQMDLDKK